LPSFWVPSITPSSNTTTDLHTITKKAKHSPVCPSSPADKPHYYSLHSLVTVAFTEEKDAATKANQRICPACNKVLSNTSKAMLAKPCGHVLCKNCVTKFMTPTGVHDAHAPEIDQNKLLCYVCETDLTNRKESSGKAKGKEDGKLGKEKIVSYTFILA
jgi:nitric oxide synthase-interacting protein